MERRRSQIAGVFLVLGPFCFWVSWTLMPMPGTTDPAFILEAVSGARPAVWASCVLQLVSAAVWAAGLVLAPGPTGERGQRAWWAGASLLAIGMTGSSADAIYHLVAYELTDTEVAPAVARSVMMRFQGPDLILLLPSVGAFFAGLVLYAVGAVAIGLVPKRSLWLMGAAVVAVGARALLPGTTAPRVAGLLALAFAVAPIASIGWALVRRPVSAGRAD